MFDTTEEIAGGLLLFLRNGLMQSLEVYSSGDPLPMPAPDQVRWEIVERRPATIL
jgi:hypothetical protein